MEPFFLILLFVVAFLYSSVGHGGASGYLALMTLFGVATELMKPAALLLNIFVSFVSFYQFYRGGYFKWKLFYPFALASVPMAFIGSLVAIDAVTYKRILGLLLIFAIPRLFGFAGKESAEQKEVNLYLALFIGALIGFLSGMIGIGGGIILSPLILFLSWGNMKQTAPVSALFIFVNSIAGMIGLLLKGNTIHQIIYEWLIIALLGGLLGAYYARKNFSNQLLKQLLGIVLIIASIKLLFA
jgi:uncharacterized membrane protein YfcA